MLLYDSSGAAARGPTPSGHSSSGADHLKYQAENKPPPTSAIRTRTTTTRLRNISSLPRNDPPHAADRHVERSKPGEVADRVVIVPRRRLRSQAPLSSASY